MEALPLVLVVVSEEALTETLVAPSGAMLQNFAGSPSRSSAKSVLVVTVVKSCSEANCQSPLRQTWDRVAEWRCQAFWEDHSG